MRYWDASALVPLVIASAASADLERLIVQDRDVATWWGSLLECESAVRRKEREGVLSAEAAETARARLRAWHTEWTEVQPGDRLREDASRLLAVHPLRSGDALQLSAALSAARAAPSTLPFLTLDRRLAEAARREGFVVLPDATQAHG